MLPTLLFSVNPLAFLLKQQSRKACLVKKKLREPKRKSFNKDFYRLFRLKPQYALQFFGGILYLEFLTEVLNKF
jgi:hypothetical protein